MKNARAGVPLRATLSQSAYANLTHLKSTSRRTYADIFRIAFYLHQHRPELFDSPVTHHEKTVTINFRGARRWAGAMKDKAWEEGVSRDRYFGHLLHCIFDQFPITFLEEVLTQQLDRVCRIVSKGEKNGSSV
jgi:hypothetical protein